MISTDFQYKWSILSNIVVVKPFVIIFVADGRERGRRRERGEGGREREADRQRERDRDSETVTDRQTDKDRERERERKRESTCGNIHDAFINRERETDRQTD